MHGSILVLIKRFIVHQYDYSLWANVLERLQLDNDFNVRMSYDDETLTRIMVATAQFLRVDVQDLLEDAGEHIVPDIVMMYGKHIGATWNLFDVLLAVANGIALVGGPRNVDHPYLAFDRVSPDEGRVQYKSVRRLGRLAIGLINGFAKYLDGTRLPDVAYASRVDEAGVEHMDVLLTYTPKP
jgi:hypothetical protein